LTKVFPFFVKETVIFILIRLNLLFSPSKNILHENNKKRRNIFDLKHNILKITATSKIENKDNFLDLKIKQNINIL